jgi:hypothetical protein
MSWPCDAGMVRGRRHPLNLGLDRRPVSRGRRAIEKFRRPISDLPGPIRRVGRSVWPTLSLRPMQNPQPTAPGSLPTQSQDASARVSVAGAMPAFSACARAVWASKQAGLPASAWARTVPLSKFSRKLTACSKADTRFRGVRPDALPYQPSRSGGVAKSAADTVYAVTPKSEPVATWARSGKFASSVHFLVDNTRQRLASGRAKL